MKTYGDRLTESLRIAQKERQELADGIGVSVQAIGQVLAGKTKALTAENSAYAAKFLNVDAFWLATGHGSSTTKVNEATWPFKIRLEAFLALPLDERQRIEDYLEFSVNKWHATQDVKSLKAS
ncbi:helix-turn-helix domain-containing protein [Solimicrobium silvestre]|uniref:HTH cro/C1-type domain-containing protein n=1 Tax=Solimicrobium silvestre TaxID=2099400 RepID=A0A2S9GZD8_9BURK|nr:helix-turn-helix transcriptional regulator [Solimicrobium silvestre]PRC93070.1 hypothetical protein S2091_2156 [Solimicrobium silvestre]